MIVDDDLDDEFLLLLNLIVVEDSPQVDDVDFCLLEPDDPKDEQEWNDRDLVGVELCDSHPDEYPALQTSSVNSKGTGIDELLQRSTSDGEPWDPIYSDRLVEELSQQAVDGHSDGSCDPIGWGFLSFCKRSSNWDQKESESDDGNGLLEPDWDDVWFNSVEVSWVSLLESDCIILKVVLN